MKGRIHFYAFASLNLDEKGYENVCCWEQPCWCVCHRAISSLEKWHMKIKVKAAQIISPFFM